MDNLITIQTDLIPAYAVLHLKGSINTFAEEIIENEILPLSEKHCPFVILDFSEVNHINSAGITILIGVAARVQEEGGRLAAYGLSDHYRKIFSMVGLDEFIRLGENRETLLQQWQSSQGEQEVK